MQMHHTHIFSTSEVYLKYAGKLGNIWTVAWQPA